MGPPAQDAAASSSSPSGGSSRRGGPRLERRNASKHIPYQYQNNTDLYCSYPPSSPSPTRPSSGPASAAPSLSCSVDLSSFRIGGSGDGGGDVQLLCRNLGLSGPDEFAISLTDWEAHKAYRSSSSSASSSPSSRSHPDRPQPRESPLRPEVPAFSLSADSELPAKQTTPIQPPSRPSWPDPQEPARSDLKKSTCEGGIKGIRPPPVTLKPQPSMLKPPPSMARLPQACLVGSTWDILQSFAPEELGQAAAIRSARDFGGEDAEDDAEDEAEVLTLDDLRLGDTSEEFTGMSSISTTNDDETNDSMFYISPNGKFKRKIRSWSRGMLLGSGSFGTVYEGISDEGVFFAVKEVPLHDQGSNAQQCIFQLEQEIALLSQFEHENIVHYYGTDKEDSKLYIFLELVTQGSLVSLYRKYRLRDTHVSAYTRQILNGLTYLHERDIVHSSH